MTVAVMGQMTVAAEPGQPGGPKRDENRTGSWRWGVLLVPFNLEHLGQWFFALTNRTTSKSLLTHYQPIRSFLARLGLFSLPLSDHTELSGFSILTGGESLHVKTPRPEPPWPVRLKSWHPACGCRPTGVCGNTL